LLELQPSLPPLPPPAPPPATGPPPQAQAKTTTTKTTTMKNSKSKSAAKPVATSQPPSASVPDPTLKEPVSRTNKIYYDLQFPIKARGDLDTMAIQCLTKFLTTIYQVDETAVLLPYKSFYALNKEVLYKPGKLGQSYTAISKYFQGFCSQCLMKMMYVCSLAGYNSPQEDFIKTFDPTWRTSATASISNQSRPPSSPK